MAKIAVIGTGYVGLVSGTCFSEIGNTVICCDIDERKIDGLKNGVIPIYEPGLEELVTRNVQEGRLTFTTEIGNAIQSAEIIYIAVGTPMSPNGEADLSYVTEAAKTVASHMNGYKIVVNKSTVPVGTGKLVQQIIKENLGEPGIPFDVVSNPEFLREGSAVHDCMNMERAIIGATSPEAANAIAELHKPFGTAILMTDLETAEMIKYAANAFLATKISFINDIANICERVGADVTKVSEGLGLDSRIGKKFLQAGIGYGGSCFPKDTQALFHIARAVDYDFELLRAVMETNDRQRYRFIEKVISELGDLNGKKIAVLGLTFKPNTDDMRYSPALTVIPELIKQGAEIYAYDPIGIPEAKKWLDDSESLHYVDMPFDAIGGADACIILTEWPEVVNIDLERLRRLLKNPLIIDGRNCFAPEQMKKLGFRYVSIGRQPM